MRGIDRRLARLESRQAPRGDGTPYVLVDPDVSRADVADFVGRPFWPCELLATGQGGPDSAPPRLN